MAVKRVLVVDDEPNIGISLQMILEGEGYNVLVCRTAAEFRERAARYRRMLVFSMYVFPTAMESNCCRFLKSRWS